MGLGEVHPPLSPHDVDPTGDPVREPHLCLSPHDLDPTAARVGCWEGHPHLSPHDVDPTAVQVTNGVLSHKGQSDAICTVRRRTSQPAPEKAKPALLLSWLSLTLVVLVGTNNSNMAANTVRYSSIARSNPCY